MFGLPPAVVHSTISKMIINEELQVCMHYAWKDIVLPKRIYVFLVLLVTLSSGVTEF